MGHIIQSARGERLDLDLLKIKAQMAAAPVPRFVQERRIAIEHRDSPRSQQTQPAPDLQNSLDDMMAVSNEAATKSKTVASQVKSK